MISHSVIIKGFEFMNFNAFVISLFSYATDTSY